MVYRRVDWCPTKSGCDAEPQAILRIHVGPMYILGLFCKRANFDCTSALAVSRNKKLLLLCERRKCVRKILRLFSVQETDTRHSLSLKHARPIPEAVKITKTGTRARLSKSLRPLPETIKFAKNRRPFDQTASRSKRQNPTR